MLTVAQQSMHANSGSAEYACEQRLCRVCMLTVAQQSMHANRGFAEYAC